MSVACPICDNYHGHNQETHNDHYETALHGLLERVAALERDIATLPHAESSKLAGGHDVK